MPRRDPFRQHHYYHIYNRGINKNLIFKSEEDYLLCIKLLKQYCEKFNISVIAYCLMPNHYHFLLRQDSEIPISKMMGSMFNSYTQRFNRRHNRSGRLFESQFQHVFVESNEQLLLLCQYIHANPLNAGLVEKLDDWSYSNLPEWLGKRSGSLWDAEFVTTVIGSVTEYEKDVIAYAIRKQTSRR